MRHATYLLVLGACLLATAPLEFLLGARVYRRPSRLTLAVLPVAIVFIAWDVLAIRAGWWRYDPAQVVGANLPGRLPVEELLFFLVIPICAILTLEAVRVRRPDWSL